MGAGNRMFHKRKYRSEENRCLSACNQTWGLYECEHVPGSRKHLSELFSSHYLSCWTPYCGGQTLQENGQQTIWLDPLFIPLNTNPTRTSLWNGSEQWDYHKFLQTMDIVLFSNGALLNIILLLQNENPACENCWNTGFWCLSFINTHSCWNLKRLKLIWGTNQTETSPQRHVFQIRASGHGQSAGNCWALLTIPLHEICTEANDVCITLCVSCCANSIAGGGLD